MYLKIIKKIWSKFTGGKLVWLKYSGGTTLSIAYTDVWGVTRAKCFWPFSEPIVILNSDGTVSQSYIEAWKYDLTNEVEKYSRDKGIPKGQYGTELVTTTDLSKVKELEVKGPD